MSLFDAEEHKSSRTKEKPVEFEYDVDDLDMTTDEIDWDEMNEGLNYIEQDKLISDATQKGIDIREHSKQIEEELIQVEEDSIKDYLQESERLADLYEKIQECDFILENMESILHDFQTNIGNLSESIKTLQERSYTMNIQLNNRKGASKSLSNFVEQVYISDDLIKKIYNSPVDEKYVEFLVEMDKKIDFQEKLKFTSAVAANQMKPHLDNLRNTLIDKLKKFLMKEFSEFKKPKASVKEIQEGLLKYKYFFKFLSKHAPEISKELCTLYVDSISNIYYSHIYAHRCDLLKCEDKIAKTPDLIIEAESTSIFSNKNKHNVMLLGDRYKVADDSKYGIIFPKTLSKHKGRTYTYDIIFKSLNVYLTQIGNGEYLFLQDFFEDVTLFTEIFAKITSTLVRTWNVFCNTSFDILGVLIMIRVLRQLEVALNKRGVLGLNDYFEEVSLLLFSKFKSLLDLNAQSIKEANLQKLVKTEFDSNDLPKRYSILTTSIVQLNKDDTLKKHIEGHMELLRKPFDELLKSISELNPHKTKKMVYLINSYDIIRMNLIRNKLECSDLSYFKVQLQEIVQQFVQDELKNYFGYLISYVDQTELIVDEKKSIVQNFSKIDSNSLEELIKTFEKNWKQSLGQMHSNMIKFFRNFDMGMEILQNSWSILVDYYDKLHKIVKLCYQNPPFRSSLVSPQFIIYEMRKYVKDF
eukprot:gene4739-8322_t